jgi:hypothetical protein
MALPGRADAVYIDVLCHETSSQVDEQRRQPHELHHQEIEAALILRQYYTCTLTCTFKMTDG